MCKAMLPIGIAFALLTFSCIAFVLLTSSRIAFALLTSSCIAFTLLTAFALLTSSCTAKQGQVGIQDVTIGVDAAECFFNNYTQGMAQPGANETIVIASAALTCGLQATAATGLLANLKANSTKMAALKVGN